MLNIGKAVDLVRLVQEAYALSQPVGLGFIHFRPGGLSTEEAKAFIDATAHAHIAVMLDYVSGRCCKLTIFKDRSDGMYYVDDKWYDHDGWEELFARTGITDVSKRDEES